MRTRRTYGYALAGASVGAAALLRRRARASAPHEIRRSISVQKPRDEVYRLWREPRNVERVWAHFAEVAARDDGGRWRARAPLGRTLEWETRIVEDRPGELVRWESLEGASLANDGSVEFRDAPGEWGTEVALTIRFDAPRALGDAAARMFELAPKLVADKALRRFKSLVEAGEIPTTESNPSARES